MYRGRYTFQIDVVGDLDETDRRRHREFCDSYLGHADISVMLNTYTYVLPDARAEVVKKIEEVLF